MKDDERTCIFEVAQRLQTEFPVCAGPLPGDIKQALHRLEIVEQNHTAINDEAAT
jgi:hypothetical protein